jgi:hypothetical protein
MYQGKHCLTFHSHNKNFILVITILVIILMPAFLSYPELFYEYYLASLSRPSVDIKSLLC